MKVRAVVARPVVFLLLTAILSEAVGTIPLGQGKPNRIVFHPDGRTAWVVYDKSHDLGVIDAEARKLIKRVRIGGNPYNLAFTPDGSHLLVLDWSSDTSSDEVIFYDLKAEKIDGRVDVSTWPAHAIFSRDGKLLYVSGETAGDVTVIDVAQRTVVGRIVHGGGDAMGLALTADGKTLYAAAGENKAILKIDTGTNKAVGEIPLHGGNVLLGIDLQQEGAFLHQLAFLDGETDDATADVRGHIDLAPWLYLAAGRDRRHQVALLHGLDAHFNRLLASLRGRGRDDHADTDNGNAEQ